MRPIRRSTPTSSSTTPIQLQAPGGQSQCGTVPQVGDTGTSVDAFSGELSSGSPQGAHSLSLSLGVETLRIAMNAQDDGSDFDLYVKHGSPPTPLDFDFDCNVTNVAQSAPGRKRLARPVPAHGDHARQPRDRHLPVHLALSQTADSTRPSSS